MLSSLIAGSEDVVYWKDAQGRFRLINDAGARLVGRTPDEVIGRTDADLFEPDTAAQIRADDLSVLESGQRQLFERTLIVEGEPRTFRIAKWPWCDAEGKPQGLLGMSRDVTEAQHAEALLRESEQRFRILVEHAPEAIVLFDTATGRFVDANSNALRLFGTSLEQLLEVGPTDVSTPFQPDGQSTAEAVRARLAQVEAGEIPVFEWTLRDIQGCEILCEVRLVRLPGEKGLIRGSVLDISERRRAEQLIHDRELALQASEKRYRLLVEESIVGTLILQNRRIVFANPEFARTVGFRVDELLALPYEEARGLVFDDDRDQVFERVVRRLAGEEVESRYHYRVVRRDGQVRWLEAFASIVDYYGQPAVMSTTFDITARREAEQAVVASEARLRDFLRALPDPIFELDPAGRIVDIHAERVAGLPGAASELVGRGFGDLLDGADRESCALAIAASRSDGDSRSFEFEWETTDGRETFEARAVAATEARTLIVARNITERKKLETDLRQAQKMDAVGRLAGGVAHDFNNQLTVITGNAELALGQPDLTAESRSRVEQILRTAGQAASLTQQLLTFSRKQPVVPENVDLNAVVGDARSMLRRLIEEDIVLTANLAPGSLWVRVDRAQVEQVLVNLVVNARDAMTKGGELEIETREITVGRRSGLPLGLAAGRYATLSVRDNGSGISEQVKAHLFEPFMTTKPAGKGTGLGLAMSYGIVKRHGGHIEIESETGRGTLATVYLPRIEPTVELPKAPTPPRSGQGSETILLAEDDDGVRSLVADWLDRLGYTVLAAGHGREALELLEAYTHPVHLLVTDVVMPGMPGRELAEQVRARLPGIKVLFMSGYTDDVILERQLLDHDLDLLRKPFRLPDLTERIRQALEA